MIARADGTPPGPWLAEVCASPGWFACSPNGVSTCDPHRALLFESKVEAKLWCERNLTVACQPVPFPFVAAHS